MKPSHFAVVVVCLAVLSAPAQAVPPPPVPTAATRPATRPAPAGEAAAAYRAMGNLDRLLIMQVAVEECDFADDVRDEALRVMDQARDRVLKAVEREAATPSDAPTRKRKMSEAADPFAKDIRGVLGEDDVRAAQIRMTLLMRELALISADADLAGRMKPLALTDAQSARVQELIDRARETLRRLDAADGVPVAEKRTGALLDARRALRLALDDEQRQQWDDKVEEAQRTPTKTLLNTGTIRSAPGPAPPAAEPPSGTGR